MQVWGALLPGPQLFVVELTRRAKSSDYMDFIESCVLPHIRALLGNDFELQQDNCSTHVSKHSLKRFKKSKVELLPWVPRSPDLDIIENVWAMLSHVIYDGRQYSSKDELWRAIDAAVADLNAHKQDLLNDLFASIPERLLECVDRKGDLNHH